MVRKLAFLREPAQESSPGCTWEDKKRPVSGTGGYSGPSSQMLSPSP